jgi:hypothetical protein
MNAAGGFTRRRALTGGAAAVGSVVPVLVSVRGAFAQAADDSAVLKRAVTLELTAAAAYRTAASSGLLSRRLQQIATLFRRQGSEHAKALADELRRLQKSPPTTPDTRRLEGLRGLRTEAEVVRFLIGLETAAVGGYHEAQKTLRDGRLLQLTAQIMANEGQHLVVLRQAVRQDPIPEPFETGKRDD